MPNSEATTTGRESSDPTLAVVRVLPDEDTKNIALIVLRSPVTFVEMSPYVTRSLARRLLKVANEVDPHGVFGATHCKIDSKYAVIDSEIVNREGVKIPHDEPVILLRARDRIAQEIMQQYYERSAENSEVPQHQVRQVSDIVAQWKMFAERNPGRMKFPD